MALPWQMENEMYLHSGHVHKYSKIFHTFFAVWVSWFIHWLVDEWLVGCLVVLHVLTDSMSLLIPTVEWSQFWWIPGLCWSKSLLLLWLHTFLLTTCLYKPLHFSPYFSILSTVSVHFPLCPFVFATCLLWKYCMKQDKFQGSKQYKMSFSYSHGNCELGGDRCERQHPAAGTSSLFAQCVWDILVWAVSGADTVCCWR